MPADTHDTSISTLHSLVKYSTSLRIYLLVGVVSREQFCPWGEPGVRVKHLQGTDCVCALVYCARMDSRACARMTEHAN